MYVKNKAAGRLVVVKRSIAMLNGSPSPTDPILDDEASIQNK